MTDFNPTAYVNSHGKTPRGRGCWAFQVTWAGNNAVNGETHFSPCMTYSDAKVWVGPVVRAEFPDSVLEVSVCP